MSERFMLGKKIIFVEKNKKDRQLLNDFSICEKHLHCYLANPLALAKNIDITIMFVLKRKWNQFR